MPRRSNPFQKLVKWLHDSLAGPGVKVVESAEVYDHEAKKDIEVDVLIEFSKMGASYRACIECRDHKRDKGGPSWIRELVTKRADCRFDKMVAVHSKGFTKAAIKVARKHNILALTLESIPLSRASNSLAMRLFGKPLVSWIILRRELGVLDVGDLSDVEIESLSATHFFLADRETRVPIDEVIGAQLSRNPPPTDDILEGHYVDRDGAFQLKETEYYVRCNDRFIRVRQLKVFLRIFKARSLTASLPMQLRDTGTDCVISEVVAQQLPGPGGIYTWGVSVDESQKPQLFIETPASVNPLDLRSELRVTYQEGGNGEKKSVTIPGRLILLDKNGKSIPIYQFTVRIISIDHDGPAALRDDEVLGFYLGDNKTRVRLEELIREEIRRSRLPADGIQPGERRRVNANVAIQNGGVAPLLMQVRRNDEVVFARVNQVHTEVEFWLADRDGAGVL